ATYRGVQLRTTTPACANDEAPRQAEFQGRLMKLSPLMEENIKADVWTVETTDVAVRFRSCDCVDRPLPRYATKRFTKSHETDTNKTPHRIDFWDTLLESVVFSKVSRTTESRPVGAQRFQSSIHPRSLHHL